MSAAYAHSPTVDSSRLPDPGEPVPVVAWPTVALFVAAAVLFAGSSALAVSGTVPWIVSIALNSVACYLFFTVLHDACHRTTSTHDWVNRWLGRVSALFLAPPFASYSVFRYIHMQHHRFTNEDPSRDPDAYTTNGPAWTWPFRWATIDFHYYRFYFPLLGSRPLGDKIELAGTAIVSIGAVLALFATGYGAEALLLYLLPTRISITFLGFAFDFLPHHGLDATPKEDRYRTTRNRVGREWIASPLLLYQNYHLVHHLHPLIPFYRYVRAWRRNENTYLENDPALSTLTGRELSADDYRRMRHEQRL